MDPSASYLYGGASDSHYIDEIVNQIKSQGIFDQWRKDCIADVDTKPAYQNLKHRVESSVRSFLDRRTWRPDLIKNQVRENLRRHILELGFIERGVDRIVEQVVKPKILPLFRPAVESAVYKFYGIEKPIQVKEETTDEEPPARSENAAVATEKEEVNADLGKRSFKPLPVISSQHAEDGTPPPGEEDEAEASSHTRRKSLDEISDVSMEDVSKPDTAPLPKSTEERPLAEEEKQKSPGLSSISSEDDFPERARSPESVKDDFESPAFEKIELNLPEQTVQESLKAAEKPEENFKEPGAIIETREEPIEGEVLKVPNNQQEVTDSKEDANKAEENVADAKEDEKLLEVTKAGGEGSVASAESTEKLKESHDIIKGPTEEPKKPDEKHEKSREDSRRDRSHRDRKRDKDRDRDRSSRKSDSRDKDRSHRSRSDRRDRDRKTHKSSRESRETEEKKHQTSTTKSKPAENPKAYLWKRPPHKPKIWDYLASLPEEYFDLEYRGTLSDISASPVSSHDESDFDGNSYFVLSDVEVDEDTEAFLVGTQARLTLRDAADRNSPADSKRVRRTNPRYQDSYVGEELETVDSMGRKRRLSCSFSSDASDFTEDSPLPTDEAQCKRLKMEEPAADVLKEEELKTDLAKDNRNRKSSTSAKQPQQRYDSSDLYKPRPTITPSSRRRRNSQNTP